MSLFNGFCQSEHHSGSSLLRGSVSADLHLPAESVHLRPGRASLLLSARCPLEHPHHVGQRCASYGTEFPLFVIAPFVDKTSRRFELRGDDVSVVRLRSPSSSCASRERAGAEGLFCGLC